MICNGHPVWGLANYPIPKFYRNLFCQIDINCLLIIIKGFWEFALRRLLQQFARKNQIIKNEVSFADSIYIDSV